MTPAFFLSGFAALCYEIAWMRRLVPVFGVTYFAITTILVTFMFGLALGGWAAGRWLDRTKLNPILAFALIELFLALYAHLFPYLLQVTQGFYLLLATGSELGPSGHTALRFLGSFILLFLPTLASGATLPIAAQGFIRSRSRIGSDMSLLYGLNVLGAAFGAFLAGFYLIGLIGFPGVTWCASLANGLAALLALLAARGGMVFSAASAKTESPWSSRAVILLSATFTTGFSALAVEVLWTRIFSQAGFNPATRVFGFVLVIWLLGHAVGAFAMRPLARRLNRPELAYGLCALFFGIFTLFSLLLLMPRSLELCAVGWLRAIGLVLPTGKACIALPALFLPAVCSGFMFPLASSLSIARVDRMGTAVGKLSAISTIGGIFGSFIAGFFLLPALGAIRGLILIGLLCLLAGLTIIQIARPLSKGQLSSAIAAILGLGLLLVLLVKPWSHMILFPGEQMVRFDEGLNSSTAVVDHPTAGRFMLLGGERLKGGGSDLSLALRLAPTAREIAIIGLGTGSVAASALERQFDSVTAIDIDGEIPSFLPLMQDRHASLFTPPRFRFVENDGRHFLLTNPDRYDIIVNDAAIYAWYLELSTLEFNRLARSRLKKEGLYIGRLHLFRITEMTLRRELATFLEVFPNAAFWKLTEDIGMLVGRNGDGPVDSSPSFEGAPLMDASAMRARAADALPISDDHPLHVPDIFLRQDLYPILEYTSPANLPGEVTSGAFPVQQAPTEP